MADQPKSKDVAIRSRNLFQLPASICEECDLIKGSKMKAYWGKNFSCVVIVPVTAKLSDTQADRIRILTTLPLDIRQ